MNTYCAPGTKQGCTLMILISFDLQNRTTQWTLIIPILKMKQLRPKNVKSFMGIVQGKDGDLYERAPTPYSLHFSGLCLDVCSQGEKH